MLVVSVQPCRRREKAMAFDASAAPVHQFRRIGWEWGGNWGYPKDYQHFSATGT